MHLWPFFQWMMNMENKIKHAYIHVPFCNHICAYCDFSRVKSNELLMTKWLSQIQIEIDERLKPRQLETIYIGGGTPNSLSDDQLIMLLESLQPYIEIVEEYTIELNPELITKTQLLILKQYGINRVSLGVQSFQPELLKEIHRIHSLQDIKNAIRLLSEVEIHNISIDLMYGLPTQTFEMWKQDINIFLGLHLPHVSLYSLTIEPNSEFGRNHVTNIDEDKDAQFYEYAIQVLEDHNYHHYEISNFALLNHESIHNKGYWQYHDFYGIGCGASGKECHKRYTNKFRLDTYCESGREIEMENLSKEDEMFEMIMMNLRMKEGLSLIEFYKKFHIEVCDKYQNAISKTTNLGWIEIDAKRMRVTKKGFSILHEVLLPFMN